VAGAHHARDLVQRQADVVVADDGCRAGVDAHPDPDLEAFRPSLAGERVLAGGGRAHGPCCRGEGGEESVALRAEDGAAVFLDGTRKQLPMPRQQWQVVVGQLLYQPSRAFDIGEEEADRAARQLAHSSGGASR